jgi:hypothetical protein
MSSERVCNQLILPHNLAQNMKEWQWCPHPPQRLKQCLCRNIPNQRILRKRTSPQPSHSRIKPPGPASVC